VLHRIVLVFFIVSALADVVCCPDGCIDIAAQQVSVDCGACASHHVDGCALCFNCGNDASAGPAASPIVTVTSTRLREPSSPAVPPPPAI